MISLDSDSHPTPQPFFLFLVSLHCILLSPFLSGNPSDSGFCWMIFLTSVLVPTQISMSLFLPTHTPPGFCPSSKCLRPPKPVALAPDHPAEAISGSSLSEPVFRAASKEIMWFPRQPPPGPEEEAVEGQNSGFAGNFLPLETWWVERQVPKGGQMWSQPVRCNKP